MGRLKKPLSQLVHPAILIIVLALIYTGTVGRNPQGGPSERDASAALLRASDIDNDYLTSLDLPGEPVEQPAFTSEQLYVAAADQPIPARESVAPTNVHLDKAVIQQVDVESEVVPAPVEVVETTGVAASTRNEQPASKRVEVYTHTIRSGETLTDIARLYDVDVDTILAANFIPDPNRIRVGEKLSIPSVRGVIHTVQRGESLWNIANYYNVTIESIVEANEITNPNTLRVGQKLVVPGAQALEALRQREAIVSPSGQLLRNFSWPTTGRISSHFGPRWGRMHNGLDIAVPTGTPIRAAAAGTVTYSAEMGSYGLLVIIDHGNGVETRYAHLSRLVAKVGQRVARGDLIAYSGNTGNSTGPHLHFEIRRNGVALDPIDFLR